MKQRTKIFLTILPLLLAGIVLINLFFGMFFEDFVLALEQSQVQAAKESVSSYISEKLAKYLANANDWGHWDDTFLFVRGENGAFVRDNITEETFRNLDLDFMVFTGPDGAIYHQQHYSFREKAFSPFPEGFMDGFRGVLEYSRQGDDAGGLFRMGDGFYFVAATDITDSIITEKPVGKMIIGKRIDGVISAEIEKISGCTLGPIRVTVKPGAAEPDGTGSTVHSSLTDNGEAIDIELIISNAFDPDSAVLFPLRMPRTFYLMGIKKAREFAINNTAGSLAVALLIFLLLGLYLTGPFRKLIRDVQKIDLTRKAFERLPEGGKDEFAYLRRSVNGLLDRIEQGQRDLMDSREKLSATLLSVGDGVLSVDIEGRIQFINPVAQRLTGWSAQDAAGRMVEDVFVIVNEFTRETVPSPVRRVFELNEIVELQNHTLLLSRDGREIPVEDTASPIRDMEGNTIGCVLVFRDFSERKERQRRIEYLSYHDQLTGLYNRRFFDEAIKRLDTAENLPLSFVYADVNGLKTFNDAFGHQSGDRMIQMVADVLKTSFRPGDVAARVGGDEFVILLPRMEESLLEGLVARIRGDAEKLVLMDIPLSVSFGWSTKTQQGQSAAAVMKTAEDYMYRRKISDSAGKHGDTIRSILSAVLYKSPAERDHSSRVGVLCEAIGRVYGLSEEETRELRTVGEVHDIGKIAVDEAILNKREGLTEEEWAQIRRHPETGFRLLGTSSEYHSICEYVLSHHERWDGAGYPRGLRGEEIPWKARVISIAEAYDAMVTGQGSRLPRSREDAAEEIRRNAGTQFDPGIAEVFIRDVLKGQEGPPDGSDTTA